METGGAAAPAAAPATAPVAVTVLAPSGGAAAFFPALRAQGVRRLGDLLGLDVRLLPTATLAGDALTPRARAADLNAAFGDASVAVIVCTIGGDDCVRVLPHLDAALIRANPKPLLGYSDITSLHLYLWNLGHVSLYGGALLCQFAISGPGMHGYTAESVRAAVLEPEQELVVKPSEAFQDGYLEWGDEANLSVAKELEPNPGWEWVGWESCEATTVEGVLWGGCLEVLTYALATRKYIPAGESLAEALRGAVLFVETSNSDNSTAPLQVYSFFQSLGGEYSQAIPSSSNHTLICRDASERVVSVVELGVLGTAAALLVGRPQTVCRGSTVAGGSEAYKTAQRGAILRAIGEYCPVDRALPVVFGLDFGHTDPQVLVPSGGVAKLHPQERTLAFSYQPAVRVPTTPAAPPR